MRSGETCLLRLPRKQKSLQPGKTQLHFRLKTEDPSSVHIGLRGNDILEEGRLADATVTPDDQNATHPATSGLKETPEFLLLQLAAQEHGPIVAWLHLGTSQVGADV